jgi:VWFA-related protein
MAGDPLEFTYRTNATEVRLNFSAMDQNNHGVATLQASDFAVVDKDDVVRKFQSFSRSDWTNLEIAILIGASESVSLRFREEIPEIFDLVSRTAGIPDENLSLFTFQGSQPALLCAGDCRASHAAGRLAAERTGGLTPLFDSIIFASDFLSRHGKAHAEKVLIVFSDGADTISQHSLADALDAALRNDVQIDGVDLNPHSSTSPDAAVLRTVADATGGRYFSQPNGSAHAMNVILEDFEASYTVSYRLPSHASGFHSVQILPTHNLNLQFRSRNGYYFQNQAR